MSLERGFTQMKLEKYVLKLALVVYPENTNQNPE
jgi:hypothetical protein